MVQRSEIYWMMKEGPIIKCFANEKLFDRLSWGFRNNTFCTFMVLRHFLTFCVYNTGRFRIIEMGGSYLRKRFFTCPFIFPKYSMKFKMQNFAHNPSSRHVKKIDPLYDMSKIFRLPPKF